MTELCENKMDIILDSFLRCNNLNKCNYSELNQDWIQDLKSDLIENKNK